MNDNLDLPAVHTHTQTETVKTYEVTSGQAAAYGGGVLALGAAIGFAVGFMRGKLKGAESVADQVQKEASSLRKGMDTLRDLVVGKKEKPVVGEVVDDEPTPPKSDKDKPAEGGKAPK